MKIVRDEADCWTAEGLPKGMTPPVAHPQCSESEYRVLLRACADDHQYNTDHGLPNDIKDTYEERRRINGQTDYPANHRQHMINLLRTMANPTRQSVLGENLALSGTLDNHDELIYLRSAAKYVCDFIDRIVGDTEDGIHYFNATRETYPVNMRLPNGQIEEIPPTPLETQYYPIPIGETTKRRQERMYQTHLKEQALRNGNYNGETFGNDKIGENGESDEFLAPGPISKRADGSPESSGYGSSPHNGTPTKTEEDMD